MTVKTIAQECMALFNTDSFKQKVRSKLPCDLNSLCKSLKVDDILLVDGTEIDLNYSCADNFHCKGKGRDSKDGDKARPGLKLHVIFSVKLMTFVQIEITEAVGDERECVHPENFKNVLFITDRGYVSEKLEQSIEESGNLFLIRGKSNSDSTIKKAFLDNGKEASQFKESKVSELPHDISPDMDVINKRNHSISLIVRANKKSKSADKRNIIRTNIPRDRLGAAQLMRLYRVRWAIELFNKANKRSNCLMSINSSKKNIILEFILMSLIVSMFKSYCAVYAAYKGGISFISMLKLHKLNDSFTEMFNTILTKGWSSIYQFFKELLEKIAASCQRTNPSKRDKILLKDLPYLLEQIVNQPKTSSF